MTDRTATRCSICLHAAANGGPCEGSPDPGRCFQPLACDIADCSADGRTAAGIHERPEPVPPCRLPARSVGAPPLTPLIRGGSQLVCGHPVFVLVSHRRSA